MNQTSSIGSLSPDTKLLCDREFNQQLDNTDGNVFIYPGENFQGIKLTSPNEAGLKVLHYLADLSCPVSMARLCVALHPDIGAEWSTVCSSLSLLWLERSITALEFTVYDPSFSDVYRGFVNCALNTELMELLNVFRDDLNEDVATLDITLQAIHNEVSLFQPRGAFV